MVNTVNDPYHPYNTSSWQLLDEYAVQARKTHIRDYFLADESRAQKYSVEVGGLFLDYSKNLISDDIRAALLNLAQQSPLRQRIDAMFTGEPINTSENRAVLHTALRSSQAGPESASALKRRDQVQVAFDKLALFVERVRSGEWRSLTGDRFTDIINIGIGGSDLGPRMVCRAMEEYASNELKVHFIANVDGADINCLLKQLNPANTLVIISSKTFTTQETMMNARVALDWLGTSLGIDSPFACNHVLAVTANTEQATKLGVSEERIFEFWDWVGGRYSLWSSIGLSIALTIGAEGFSELLEGARLMDEHFRSAPFASNMPVILGLVGLWYHNFLGSETHAIIPYCERLSLLPSFLQQLDMESNGKRVTLDGQSVSYTTGPIIWGQTGTNGQHAFFQLLHQGTHLVPLDLIGLVRDRLSTAEQHRALIGNMLGQSAALLAGDGDPVEHPEQFYPGNRPSNTILLDELSPTSLGALIALYEHKVFVQGALWNINSFDQWGVELGKRLANSLLEGSTEGKETLDPSSQALITRVWPQETTLP